VISNAKVYVVWWGTGANIKTAITRSPGGIADFYAGILNSNYIDSLAEYNTTIAAQVGSKAGSAGTGQTIGRGNYAGTYALTTIPSGNVTDAQIQTALEGAINAKTLPQPDENTLYAIYFPPGVRITIDGDTSCLGFGAYHDATPLTQHHAAYAVMPDCGDSFSGVTSVSSHELVEAITDFDPTPADSPDYPQAWNTSDGNEVGDLCESSQGTVSTPLGSFTAQGIWDQLTHACKVTHAAAADHAVNAATLEVSLAAGASRTITFQTQTVAGTAQRLTLAVKAPPGVTATLASGTATSGDDVTVTLAASADAAVKDGQIVLQTTATGSGGQVHSASVLAQVTR
jgi:hypothetical protein